MLLMDLGGWTMDLMRIDNAIPVADTAHSLELGMIRCVDDIREQVRRETGLSLTDIVSSTTSGPCIYAVEPLCTGRYARRCERSGLSSPSCSILPLIDRPGDTAGGTTPFRCLLR